MMYRHAGEQDTGLTFMPHSPAQNVRRQRGQPRAGLTLIATGARHLHLPQPARPVQRRQHVGLVVNDERVHDRLPHAFATCSYVQGLLLAYRLYAAC
jgi:hypothetical protein